MATIIERNGTYQIQVSAGYDLNGKHIRRTFTWKPAPGMTKKQIEKELKRQEVMYEEKVASGVYLDGNVKFIDFVDRWFKEYAETQIRETTYYRYQSMIHRITAAFGHMKLEKIQPQHIIAFYKNLAESGIREDTKYKTTADLHALIKEKKTSQQGIANATGVSVGAIRSAVRGQCVIKKTADAITDALGLPFKELFEPVDPEKTLSGTTIHRYHELLSSIFNTAVRWQVIFSNPCERVQPPKKNKPEPKFLDEVQARELLTLLEDEPPQFRIMVTVLMFTGLRRAELLGLRWEDIDTETGLLSVKRNLLYHPQTGTFESETKTRQSQRTIKVPAAVCDLFREQKALQAARRLQLGDKWQNSGYIFTAWNGAALNPTTLSCSFSKFCKKHNLTGITIHGLRHTNATLQIAQHVPITTVAHRLGHVDATTTAKIYAHAIQSADAAAAQILDDLLSPATAKHG